MTPVGTLAVDIALEAAVARVEYLERLLAESAVLLPPGAMRSRFEAEVAHLLPHPAAHQLLRGTARRAGDPAIPFRAATLATENGFAEVDRPIATAREGGPLDAASPTATSLDRGLLPHAAEVAG